MIKCQIQTTKLKNFLKTIKTEEIVINGRRSKLIREQNSK